MPQVRRCDKGPRHGRDSGTDVRERPTDGESRGRPLCCAACGSPVTRESARIEISGDHVHVFVNPHGIVFEIGCFSSAPGCVGVGRSQTFFSWFPGYAWRVAVCGACGVHLGWAFGEGPHFHGLVLDRLTEGDDDST